MLKTKFSRFASKCGHKFSEFTPNIFHCHIFYKLYDITKDKLCGR